MLENMHRGGFSGNDLATIDAAEHFTYQAVLNAGIRRIEDDERARDLDLVASLPLLDRLYKYLGYIEDRMQVIMFYDSAIKAFSRMMLPGIELLSTTAQEKIPFDDDIPPGSLRPRRAQRLANFLEGVDEMLKETNAAFARIRLAAVRTSDGAKTRSPTARSPSTGGHTDNIEEDSFFTPPSSPRTSTHA